MSAPFTYKRVVPAIPRLLIHMARMKYILASISGSSMAETEV